MKKFNPDKEIVISQKAKFSAPSKFSDKNDNTRRTKFTFSLANMIQMASAKESQLLLQTMDIVKRLKAQKLILAQASNILSEQAVKTGIFSTSDRDEIRRNSFEDDYDEDILPKSEQFQAVKAEKDEWDINNIE